MLAVDQRSFDRERFWGPNAIKPLNFNYDFTSRGENIWTLTDGLFVSDRRRLLDDLESQGTVNVLFTRQSSRNSAPAKRKKSSRYRHYPSIDDNVHQKSSPPARRAAKVKATTSTSGTNSSRITSSGESRTVTPLRAPSGSAASRKRQQVFSTSKRNFKGSSSPRRKSKDAKKNLFSPAVSHQGFMRAHEKRGVSVKLSLEETERLLKSLDFRVRTRKKVTTRERSKSERVPKAASAALKKAPGVAVKAPFQKRAAGSPTKRARAKKTGSPVKRDRMLPWTSQNQLVRSSRRTSSSSTNPSRKKSLSSASGLGDLLGPLPRVKWTPEVSAPQRAAERKKQSEATRVTLMKTNKMKAALKKVAERTPPSQELTSEEVEGSSQEAVALRKVRTTPMKIIPKVTLNNQLLKSTTNKVEKPQEKKVSPKTMSVKKGGQSSTTTLWTPDKIALLDQITTDQQLKAVLMSAGDTYMKSRKNFGIKATPRQIKPPMKSTLTSKKKETQAEDAKATKSVQADQLTAGKPSPLAGKPGGAADAKNTSRELTDQPSEGAQTDEGVLASEDKDDGKAAPPGKNPPSKRAALKPKTNYGAKAASKPTTVVVKSKAVKLPTKTGAGAHLTTGKKEVGGSGAVKRRPKFSTSSRAKERLAQLTSEAVGPSRVQSERMAQLRRQNLDTLKKILDKSLSAQNRPSKPEEPKTAKVN